MKKHALRIGLGLAIVLVLLLHISERLRIPFVETIESIIYDARLRLTMSRTVDPRVVVLDIDEKSLMEREQGGEGRWPWPRDRMALLLDTLFDHYGVTIVGFDAVFPETDRSSGIRVLEELAGGALKGVPEYRDALARLEPTLDYDGRFARSMTGRRVVLGYTFLLEDKRKGLLPPPMLSPADFGDRVPRVAQFTGFTGNLAQFQKNAASAGHFNPLPDADGITRRVPILARYGNGFYEPLSMAMVRLLAGSPPVVPVFSERGTDSGYAGVDGVRFGGFRIPVDEDGAALVPYRGPRGGYAYHSLIDVMNQRVPIAALKGKIALVGATAPGLLDLRATPVDPVYPGVEIHANLISGILDQAIAHKPPYALGAEFALVLLLGLAMAIWLPVLAPQPATVVTLTVLLLALGINIALFHFSHIVLPLASALVMILTLFVFNMAYGFFVVTRERRQITGLFGQYVPREVVEKLADNPEQATMEGESREMTVLFTDVRGFTTISEGLEPKALSQLMNEFLTPLTEVIYKHRGTIDKYMGDCIMAFWGAPLPDPRHARNAVLAGLEMQRTLKSLQPYFESRKWPPIRIGVGVNTGRMSVGNMGSQVRLAYTVMGDAVNLASRLEGLTKEYGADVIVGEDTRRAVEAIVFREIDRVRVKGKESAVAIFEPLGPEGEVPQALLDESRLFEEALTLYRNRHWAPALERFAELRKAAPHSRLYETYFARVEYLRANPPAPDWDGAFAFQTK